MGVSYGRKKEILLARKLMADKLNITVAQLTADQKKEAISLFDQGLLSDQSSDEPAPVYSSDAVDPTLTPLKSYNTSASQSELVNNQDETEIASISPDVPDLNPAILETEPRGGDSEPRPPSFYSDEESADFSVHILTHQTREPSTTSPTIDTIDSLNPRRPNPLSNVPDLNPAVLETESCGRDSEPRPPSSCSDEASTDFSVNTPPPQKEEKPSAAPMPSTSAALCFPEDDDDGSNVIHAQTLFEERRLVGMENRTTKALDGYEELGEALDTYVAGTNRDLKLLDDALKSYGQEFAKFRTNFYIAMSERTTLVPVPDNSNTADLDTKQDRVDDLPSPTPSLPAQAPTALRRLSCYLSTKVARSFRYLIHDLTDESVLPYKLLALIVATTAVSILNLQNTVARYSEIRLGQSIAVSFECLILLFPLIGLRSSFRGKFYNLIYGLLLTVCLILLLGPKISLFVDTKTQNDVKHRQDLISTDQTLLAYDSEAQELKEQMDRYKFDLARIDEAIEGYSSREYFQKAQEIRTISRAPLADKIAMLRKDLKEINSHKSARYNALATSSAPLQYNDLLHVFGGTMIFLLFFIINIYLVHAVVDEIVMRSKRRHNISSNELL